MIGFSKGTQTNNPFHFGEYVNTSGNFKWDTWGHVGWQWWEIPWSPFCITKMLGGEAGFRVSTFSRTRRIGWPESLLRNPQPTSMVNTIWFFLVDFPPQNQSTDVWYPIDIPKKDIPSHDGSVVVNGRLMRIHDIGLVDGHGHSHPCDLPSLSQWNPVPMTLCWAQVLVETFEVALDLRRAAQYYVRRRMWYRATAMWWPMGASMVM